MERPVPCRITRDIVHLAYTDREQLCRAFMRPQEFYESPAAHIRGRYFTVAQFKRYYTAQRDGEFTYYTDWGGFNLPGKAVRQFSKVFGRRTTARERVLLEAIALGFPDWQRTDRYYVIGTVNGHRRGMEHELAHAFWYLHAEYRAAMAELMRRRVSARAIRHMREELLERGYMNGVLDDEIQAYLATSSTARLTYYFPGLPRGTEVGELRNLFGRWYCKEASGVSYQCRFAVEDPHSR